LIGSLRRDPKTQENYKDTRREFHPARLEAIRQTDKKGMGKHRGRILNTPLRIWQFCGALCKALSRRGKVGIKRERLSERNNRPLVLIE
jgi:hypothetical protein